MSLESGSSPFREHAHKTFSHTSEWLRRYPIRCLAVTVLGMLLILQAGLFIAAPNTTWDLLSWVILGLIAYSLAFAIVGPSRRVLARTPEIGPSLRWLMAVSAFL